MALGCGLTSVRGNRWENYENEPLLRQKHTKKKKRYTVSCLVQNYSNECFILSTIPFPATNNQAGGKGVIFLPPYLLPFSPPTKFLRRKNIAHSKYLSISFTALTLLKALHTGTYLSLVSAAYSKNSWKRTSAALSSYIRFAMDWGTTMIWPFSPNNVNKYLPWALKKARFSPSNVKVYLRTIWQLVPSWRVWTHPLVQIF